MPRQYNTVSHLRQYNIDIGMASGGNDAPPPQLGGTEFQGNQGYGDVGAITVGGPGVQNAGPQLRGMKYRHFYTTDPGPTNPQAEALTHTVLVPLTSPAPSANVYGPESGEAWGQPLIKKYAPYATGRARLFPWNNIVAQEWYFQMLVPGAQTTIYNSQSLGTLATVPLELQPSPPQINAYNKTMHGFPLPLGSVFPTAQPGAS